ncbi:aminoglycoside phosphotransferase (APT) family kinase protein [Tamaricihabitans halophyticus]|uniref:Aminoglycoside phosphotransferase (APT) family kinase protein n=1 Tax=Tamaricihabitans halophyticus TaxID=1262583 RepID=A0A4R2QUF0_9PSEU|nr:phosphotransferase family protein [Tamaricihabitans halophyticus]TCP53603.1 aminoglycoside phosphotransferase (APT) family kinase protein [Tamaricihabitans halophyticus]
MGKNAERAAETAEVVDQSVVDVASLASWMDARELVTGSDIRDLRPLSGGTQNIMLRFERGDRSFVLRRGPRHLRERSNRVIRREMRLLAAIADTDVPHPKLIAPCPEESVLGAAFYLMEPVTGINVAVELPEPQASDPAMRHGMGLSVVDAIAKLGAVDHLAVGLADFGRVEGFLDRQVDRWLGELASYQQYPGYPGASIGDVSTVAEWLRRNQPARWTPGILHGDYHFANVLFEPAGTAVAAIVDWEMCTVGDPLLDLGWLLATWPHAEGGVAGMNSALGGHSGFPTEAEVIARYAQHSTRDLSGIQWYAVLACFKLGIVLEGTYARACAGQAPERVGQRLHAATLSLFEQASRRINAA